MADTKESATLVRGPRFIKDHIVVTKEYRKYYMDNRVEPYSKNGINEDNACSYCDVKENIKYSTTRSSSVCPKCANPDDELINIDDVKHDMVDLNKWIPIIRDSEHNLVYQSIDTKKMGLSSVGKYGRVSYISFDDDVDNVLDELVKLSNTYLDDWSHDTFYNLPIRTHMASIVDYIPIYQKVVKPEIPVVENKSGEGDECDSDEGDKSDNESKSK